MFLEKTKRIIEKTYITMEVLGSFLEEELQAGLRGFDIKRLMLLLRGFHSKRKIPYDFNKWRYYDYISDFEQKKLQFINHPYNKLLNNKLVFSTYFKSFFRTPYCYCVINKGDISPVNVDNWIHSFNDVVNLGERKKKLILKPVKGSGAKGIYLISLENQQLLLNYKPYTVYELKEFMASLDQYLLEEYIEQSTFTKTIYSKSTNTLRIITLIDPSTSNPFIPIATLRIGSSVSAPVDVFLLGGLFSYINIENGEVSESIAIAGNGSLAFYDNHPETNARIKGLFIPGWKDLIEKLLWTAKAIAPLIKVVGWDIVITDDGFVVIEGNSGPDTKIQGFLHPLAKNQKVLNFLTYHKIR